MQELNFSSFETLSSIVNLNSQLASLIAAGANDDLDLSDFKEVLLLHQEISAHISAEINKNNKQ